MNNTEAMHRGNKDTTGRTSPARHAEASAHARPNPFCVVKSHAGAGVRLRRLQEETLEASARSRWRRMGYGCGFV
jgi:hypothetical protein